MKHAHSSTERCGSCGATLTGAYCARCGAPQPGRLSFKRIFRDFTRHITEFDIRVVKTITDLSIRPGEACRSYIDGNRQRYTNPLKYAFIVATVHIVLVTLFGLEVMSPHAESTGAAQTRAFDVGHDMVAYLIYPAMLPAALAMHWLFVKERFNFAECYVFLLFVYGHLMWLLTAFAFFDLFSSWLGTGIGQLIETAYFVWAVAGFYQNKHPVTLLKALIMRLVSIGLFLAMIQGTVWLVMTLGF